MEFEYIEGLRRNAKVVWVPRERHLYVRNVKRGGNIEYICYQKVLCNQNITERKDKNNNDESIGKHERKKKKNNKREIVLKCNARVIVDGNEKYTRNKIEHTFHENHEHIYKDMVSKNKIIDRCVAHKKVTEGLAVKVPTHDFFTLELAK